MQVMGLGGFDDDPSSPHAGPPPVMQGMPPNFPPYGYRYQASQLEPVRGCDVDYIQPGMPQQQMSGQMQSNPMFSPRPGHASSPGQPLQSAQYMAGTPSHPNGSA